MIPPLAPAVGTSRLPEPPGTDAVEALGSGARGARPAAMRPNGPPGTAKGAYPRLYYALHLRPRSRQVWPAAAATAARAIRDPSLTPHCHVNTKSPQTQH